MKKGDDYYIIDNGLDELHSFESFFKIDKLNKYSLEIRFVDIGIDNHPVNQSNNIKFIDKSILKASNIRYLKINQNVLIDEIESDFESYFFGGYNITENEHNEIEVKANSIEILLPLDYRLSDKNWFSIKELNDDDNHLLKFLTMQ